MNESSCNSCKGLYPNRDGPTHAYMSSSPGCWAVYGDVLAKEYSDRQYFDVHRLTVDAYAVQHPGGQDRQSVQSVGVHLIRLCLFLEHNLTPDKANAAMLEAGKNKHSFTYLVPPANLGDITAADVAKATSPSEHKQRVIAWAKCVWQAWSEHHSTIRQWLPEKYAR